MGDTRTRITEEAVSASVDRPHRRILLGLAIALALMFIMTAFAGLFAYMAVRSTAEAGADFAAQVQRACDEDEVAVDRRLCDDAQRVVDEAEVQDLEIQDAEIQDPEVQEPEIQDAEIPNSEQQDREVQNPERQQGESQDPETQDEEVQEPEIQDPEEQEPEVQEPENQEPEVNNPEPNDPQDPAETLTLMMGPQTWTCRRDVGSPPRNPTYTCTMDEPQEAPE